MQAIKYFGAYLVPTTMFISMNSTGMMCFIPIFVFFVFIPVVEFIVKPDKSNLEAKLATDEANQNIYDWILYLAVPIQLCALIYFFYIIQNTAFGTIEYYGRITAMGMMCGVIGINVGHELGHRHERWEQFLGEIMLLSSLNTHFLPYHNAGHHRDVATPSDPATAKKNQSLFSFWITSHFGGYIKAWKLEARRLKDQSKSVFSLSNRMVVYSISNILALSCIYFLFGTHVFFAFICAAIFGILLLQTVNYIEHYGMMRAKNEKGRYRPVRHNHSWNSDHPIGRAVLFNLSRHSDHHYNGSKKYQNLLSLEQSPQMPTGYPGMLLLALFPPLWFIVMNKRLEKIEQPNLQR